MQACMCMHKHTQRCKYIHKRTLKHWPTTTSTNTHTRTDKKTHTQTHTTWMDTPTRLQRIPLHASMAVNCCPLGIFVRVGKTFCILSSADMKTSAGMDRGSTVTFSQEDPSYPSESAYIEPTHDRANTQGEKYKHTRTKNMLLLVVMFVSSSVLL